MTQRRILLFLLFLGTLAYGFYMYESGFGSIGVASELIGKPAPDFQLKDEKGKKLTLKDFKGKVVLLHFWATWCPPCTEEFPSLDQFAKLFSKDKFAVIALSMDDHPKDIIPFKKKIPFELSVYFDSDQETAEAYGTFRLPESYLINKEGVVVQKITGPQNWKTPVWEQRVRKLL